MGFVCRVPGIGASSDDGSEQAGCLAPGTASAWCVSPAPAVPVRPAGAGAQSPSQHIPSTVQTTAS